LFPELLASAGGPAATGLQPLQQLGGESVKSDFLALLAEEAQAVPVLPAHIPPVRQSLPVSGQVLPLPVLVSALHTARLDQTVATQQPGSEPAVALKEGPKFNPAPATELQVLEPTIKGVREPSIDVIRPLTLGPVALPLTAGKPSLGLAPANSFLKDAPPGETALPVQPIRVPTGASTAPTSAPVHSGLADAGVAPVLESPPATLGAPEVEVSEIRGPERAPTTATPVPTVSAMTVTSVSQGELTLPVQQTLMPANSAELPEQLAGSVRFLATRQGGEMRLRLNPPELGHIEVKVTVSDEQTFVSITASNSLSRDVLEQHLGRLRSLLDGAGLNLADAQVSSERHGEHQSAQTTVEPIPSFPDDSLADGKEPTPSPRPSRHGVDLFA
jgi:hypothetical protein